MGYKRQIDDGPSLPPLYFLHIPKTAGTSVTFFLKSFYKRHEVCPAWLWDHLDAWPLARLKKYSVFIGHFGDALESHLGTRMRTVTVVRDPIERSISHYAHVRRDLRHPHNRLANTLSLKEFCRHPETRHMIENFQARYLASRMADPISTVKRLQPARAATLGTADAFERAIGSTLSNSELLQRALRRLHSCDAVGVTERLDETLGVFAETLGSEWSCPPPQKNLSPNRPAVDTETVALIREMTSIDAALHRAAGYALDREDLRCAS